jgi:RNA polymerase sigma factor (sigma-70 family)
LYTGSEKDIHQLIAACKRNDPRAQELLYHEFYGFAMGIVRRYAKSREEGADIVNEGFFKVLTSLHKYTTALSFQGWVRRIMINSSIDHYRRNEKHYNTIDISYSKDSSPDPDALSKLSEEEILNAISQLPASYRMVFSLHVIEGYTHEEIGKMLGISVGTSKSNLSVARTKLMKILSGETRSNSKEQWTTNHSTNL